MLSNRWSVDEKSKKILQNVLRTKFWVLHFAVISERGNCSRAKVSQIISQSLDVSLTDNISQVIWNKKKFRFFPLCKWWIVRDNHYIHYPLIPLWQLIITRTSRNDVLSFPRVWNIVLVQFNRQRWMQVVY